MDTITLQQCLGFEWDPSNWEKNWHKHKVNRGECEQIFFNRPLLLNEDVKHSNAEPRHYVLGRTDGNRQLFVAFTIRNNLIRVISARSMSRKERRIYEKT